MKLFSAGRMFVLLTMIPGLAGCGTVQRTHQHPIAQDPRAMPEPVGRATTPAAAVGNGNQATPDSGYGLKGIFFSGTD